MKNSLVIIMVLSLLLTACSRPAKAPLQPSLESTEDVEVASTETAVVPKEAPEEVRFFEGMDPSSIVEAIIQNGLALNDFQISVDDYLNQIEFIFNDSTMFEPEPVHVLINGEAIGIDMTMFKDKNLEEMKKTLEDNNYGYVDRGYIENLNHTHYIDISKVYKDPKNDWEYVITLETFKNDLFVDFVISKYTFDTVDHTKKIIMLDKNKGLGYHKNDDGESTDSMVEDMLKKSVAGTFYGEDVEYLKRIYLFYHSHQ